MKAVLDSWVCPDVDDVDTWIPTDPTDVNVYVQLFLADDTGEVGGEAFDLSILTPRALQTLLAEDGVPIIGRSMLFVAEWNWPHIVTFLRREIESLAVESWNDIVEQVGRIARWEDEDYDPDVDPEAVGPGRVRAQVRHVTSPDISDLPAWQPADRDDVSLLLDITVAADDDVDVFTLRVCTTAALRNRLEDSGTPVRGRHYLIVERWDWPAVESFLRHTAEAESADTRAHLCARLERIGRLRD